ncbi:S8 family peptidase [Jiangella asiatica]|uniref:Serine protease n=1 Tax=Jiangella asiatica TaxID=2530372 RepID=A0A4R5DD39_9ACTN|nr:S8 family serine peptidase [Jiangella asiatica]TDE10937.1 serine protease [Jiangella asiatica]
MGRRQQHATAPKLATVLLGASVVAALGASTPAALGGTPAPATSFGTADGGAVTVTLITGDQVHVHDGPGGEPAITVDSSPRPDGYVPQFQVSTRGDATYVLPTDVAALVPARLDVALFDVTALIDQGLDDAGGDQLPLILEYADDQPRTLSEAAVPGVEPRLRLDSVGAVAVDADRSTDALSQAVFGLAEAGAQPLAAGSLAGVEKIWLDARVEARLDRSTSQISAPAAWEAGYDGDGVTAAVLDSGVDDTHPDLAGQVQAAANFTEEADTVDRNGHGTHVASTIAGTGAASDGARRGVAPGAKLLSGKVLDASGGGFVSWAIAGMEWAVGQGADIVNMSLGLGPGHIEAPLLTGAVERLSAEHDVLFVIAAGNNSCTACVGSPGDAPSALTVGAVDRDDTLADFSSRGPVFRGYDAKPDVTAPGVGISAAQATAVGDDPYVALSGTSMASPHVAGAAALLAQARPELTGQELKAALMSTAVPTDEFSVFDQGSGRIDVGRVLDSPALAGSGSLSFGLVPFPEDGPAEPLRRTVSYSNVTDQPVTLQLDTALTGAAAEGLTISPDRLTIAPGATAQAEVALDVAGGTPGDYAGYLLATPVGDTTDAAALRLPVAFSVEAQHFDLTVRAIARDGRPSIPWATFVASPVVDVATGDPMWEPCTEQPAGLDRCVRVPAGTYSVMSFVYTKPAWADSDGLSYTTVPLHAALVGDPEVEVAADATVVLDAREAVEVEIETPDHDSWANPGAAADMGWARVADNGVAATDNLLSSPGTQLEERIFLQPTDDVTIGSFAASSRYRLAAPEITFDVSGLDLRPAYYQADLFSDNSWQFPMLDGEATMPVVDAGTATPGDLDGLDLDGALALVRRSDDVSVGDQANAAAAAGATMVAVYNDQPGSSGEIGATGIRLEVPTVRLSHEDGTALLERLRTGEVELSAVGTPSSPYLYELVHAYHDRIPSDLRHVADTDDLAAVERDLTVQVDGSLTEVAWPLVDGWDYSVGIAYPVRSAPAARTDYYVADPGTTWEYGASTPEDAYGSFWPEPFVTPLRLTSTETVYDRPGVQDHSWLRQPLVPGFRTDRPLARDGDILIIPTAGYVDAAGNFGEATADGFGKGYAGLFQVWHGDELLGEVSGVELPSGTIALPPGEETYRIDYSIDNRTPWAQLSTRSTTSWTFTSTHTDEVAVVPLLTLDHDLGADLTNRLPGPRERRGPAEVSVTVGHLAGADVPITDVTVEASYDDGATWRPLRVRGNSDDEYSAHLTARPPRGHNGYLSLRISATDAQGNRIDQEIIRAAAVAED